MTEDIDNAFKEYQAIKARLQAGELVTEAEYAKLQWFLALRLG
jgi:hypothetical protein